ncbi:hypothetical protein GCM10009122_22600 [Fulvivirga kasyanovii]|uniref:Uncharacterized protein n=1 Tax=Fulvivirga kasyanovii TaxID=396812 RepID=A0ABW9RNQ0_9BACT|nr:hypothetical protein [Fulvivirga kasyanovii]MTI25754.1 hypothetical protein [Fulvivirga kasyanovii]
MNSVSYEPNSFVEFITTFELDTINGLTDEDYITLYNGFNSSMEYIEVLMERFKRFRQLLLDFPLNHSSSRRRMYIINAYYLLKYAQDKLPYIKAVLDGRFKYSSQPPVCGCTQCQLDSFCSHKYGSWRDFQHHKLHLMFAHHKKVVVNTLRLFRVYAHMEGIDIEKLDLDYPLVAAMYAAGKRSSSILPSPVAVEQVKKTKLTLKLPSEAIGYLFYPLFKKIAGENVNKTELSQFLSDIFQTEKSGEVSHKQIRKGFYEVDQNTEEVIREAVTYLYDVIINKKHRTI